MVDLLHPREWAADANNKTIERESAIDTVSAAPYFTPFTLAGRKAMLRPLAVATLVLVLAGACGCTWQANRGSQAVDINPFALGSRDPVISPSNSYGYSNGEALDMRTKR